MEFIAVIAGRQPRFLLITACRGLGKREGCPCGNTTNERGNRIEASLPAITIHGENRTKRHLGLYQSLGSSDVRAWHTATIVHMGIVERRVTEWNGSAKVGMEQRHPADCRGALALLH